MTGCGNAQPGGCYVTGHDPATGEELWRVHTIARPDDPDGGDSWNGLPLESRMGNSAWISGTYDRRAGAQLSRRRSHSPKQP